MIRSRLVKFALFCTALVALIAGLVAETDARPVAAAFPGANGKIAFESSRDGNYEIYVMNADGTNQTNLTHSAAFDAGPDWSPDGTKIAFMSDRDGIRQIYVMNADGTRQTRLTNNAAKDESPTWSPDGREIAFFSNRDGNDEIYVMNADGTGQTRLTNNAAVDDSPEWSPAGTKIAFFTDRDGNVEVYVMNADGTGQTNLTNSAAKDWSPDWSPGGTKIAFYSNRDGNDQIYVMNADGTGQTRLTNNAANDDGPAWSPDGMKIAFYSIRDGNFEIYSMNADGTGQTRLTNNAGIDSTPDWQPLVDTDQDGCFDVTELFSIADQGGQRNPNYFWDFYDVWTILAFGNPPVWERNKSIDLFGDIFGVAGRFGAERPGGPPTKSEALAEALVPPPALPTDATVYHAAFDRGAPIGPDPWDLGPPDGTIDLFTDIFGVAYQFGHDCS